MGACVRHSSEMKDDSTPSAFRPRTTSTVKPNLDLVFRLNHRTLALRAFKAATASRPAASAAARSLVHWQQHRPLASSAAREAEAIAPVAHSSSPSASPNLNRMPPESQPSFFKRELPALCTDFASPAGRQLFTQALSEGYLEAYFKISQHLSAQSDPAFCGLATLTVALNALGIDPMRKWKGRQGYWRFWSDDMLDCCRTLDDVRKQGITLEEFRCLAACNGLDAELTGGVNGFNKGIEAFESAVKRTCASQKEVLAVSFSRQLLQQTGTGHFSCIGGYCEASRQVLLLETALFKYPVYWVSIDKLYEAMLPADPATNQPRGYLVLSEHKPASFASSSSSPNSSILSLNVRALFLCHLDASLLSRAVRMLTQLLFVDD